MREKDIYKGESSYCAYTRGLEHLAKFAHRDKDSKLHKHCEIHHGGRQVEFTMDIIGTFHRDSMKRQIREGIEIEMTNPKRLMNTMGEWNPSLIPQSSLQSMASARGSFFPCIDKCTPKSVFARGFEFLLVLSIFFRTPICSSIK